MYHDAPISVTSSEEGTRITIDATGPLLLAAALELGERLALIARIGLALEPTTRLSAVTSSLAPEPQPSPLDHHAPTPPPRAA